MSLQFIDTNILLYAYDESGDPRTIVAKQLVKNLAKSRQAIISIQVLQEFYVNATRKIAKQLSGDQAIERLEAFARWPTHSPLPQDAIAAAKISAQFQLSFWDAMIIRSAQQMDCAIVWSEDMKHGLIIDTVEIRNPFV